jgi:hypothetical protein
MAFTGTEMLYLNVNTNELQRQIKESFWRLDELGDMAERKATPTVTAIAVAAGLMLAASPRKVSRRSLLTFGLLK